ncbi:retrovirus polyprotein [Purpureocillium lilacinum]|uniref:Retrovirus polyprotein n=1 Tax=Purpureocillium lilacinum TaxID=33203 RepID=A0A179F0V3_PURLI|nr:retrovirus polyprotein [Purpureocillium lilacinum]
MHVAARGDPGRDLRRHRHRRVPQESGLLYIIPGQDDEVILGRTWMNREDVTLYPFKGLLHIGSQDHWVKERDPNCTERYELSGQSAATFSGLIRRARKEDEKEGKRDQRGLRIFSASMADIEKALAPKKRTDVREKLPAHYHEYLSVFNRDEADRLPPRRPGSDHRIVLEADANGREMDAPWGPLYGMSREELIVLRRTPTELLDKGFIRASSSPASAPVLFVRKPGGGLRFCVDYRGLNAITKKDRYPLPLIEETLRSLSKAKRLTKLDVIAAFHKLRVAEGDEWKTAFRTRYGLYEWLVTPFGLTGAPATFQRYINHTLRKFLDEFCSAYIDDILIYSSGSLADHRKVEQVLARLRDAGLQIDIDKCEFEATSVKYLGFIVEAGKGIRVDPEKVRAIQEWEAPRSARAVRSFLGFANYYRQFIPKFSNIASPLTALTKKDAAFAWSNECQAAFDELKARFISAPVLAQWDPDRETVVETDSSGYVTGGALSQKGDDGLMRPVAFFSKKCAPAECNYPIHDKELLAIIRCLEHSDAELRSVESFTVLTDHLNLRYFTKKQPLSERQARWAEALSRYNFTIVHRPGKDAAVPDALSRREQDMPHNIEDDRLRGRRIQLLEPAKGGGLVTSVKSGYISKGDADQAGDATAAQDESVENPFTEPELQKLWEDGQKQHNRYWLIREAVLDGERRLPSQWGLPVMLSECSIDAGQRLCWRERIWVPNHEPLRTRLMQETHDSALSGHPGRDVLKSLLARRFYWPGLDADARQFVRNCEVCGRSNVWRERRRGLLKPLPVPERIWSELSIDFVTDLPPTKSHGSTNMMVLTDRLSKSVVLASLKDITAETTAKALMQNVLQHHGVPTAIVTDRGTQFTSRMWKRLCELLRIKQRLSTAWHPETDGATERANQEVERYIRIFTTYAQDDWDELLPAAAMALNNRTATSTGLSPFFFTHGYHFEPVQVKEALRSDGKSPVAKAEGIVRRFQEATEWAQAAMASAQERQEENANARRQPSDQYKPGDKVWLRLRNIRSKRPSKKLDWLAGKYTVLETIGSHACRLDTPPGVHNVFHVSLLRLAADDPLPSQTSDDYRPPAILTDDGELWEVEEIQGHRKSDELHRENREARVELQNTQKELQDTKEELKHIRNQLEALSAAATSNQSSARASFAEVARSPPTSEPTNLRSLSMQSTPSSFSDTLYCTIDTARVEEANKSRAQAGQIRQAIETEMRAKQGQDVWRCAAVVKDARNTDRVKIICRDETELQQVKEAAQKTAVVGARVMRDQLYPVKVDNANRTAVLDTDGNVLAGAAEALGTENNVNIEQMPIESADLTAAVLRLPARDVLVVSIYVEWNNEQALASAMTLLDGLIRQFRDRTGRRTDVVLAGDFNRHDFLWGGNEVSARRQGEGEPIIDLMSEHGLCSLLPRGTKTWQGPESESTIDLVLATSELADEMVACAIHPTEHGSDHRAIQTTFDVEMPERSAPERLLFKNAPWIMIAAKVEDDLRPLPWTVDVQTQADQLMRVVLEAIHELTPRAPPLPYAKRWWTKDLTRLRRAYTFWRNQARTQRRAGSARPDLERRAKEAAKEYHDAIRKQKSSHWDEFVAEDVNIWKAAKYLKPGKDMADDKVPPLRRADGSATGDKADQAEELLATFFPPLPTRIEAEGERPQRTPVPMPDLTLEEIEEKVMAAKPWKAPGEDNLPAIVWKQLWHVVKYRVWTLFDSSIRDGVVPHQWRTAKIIPLKKPEKGDYTVTKAWRPISLLSTLGKILEAVAAERISYAVEAYGLLPANHFGARKRRSADQALMLLQEQIYKAWRMGRVLSLISFDVKGAYNGVCKERLLERLRARGIPEGLVRWIGAFCSERTACIVVNGHTLERQELPQAGLPQGSPLSPILFLFFNADLVQRKISTAGGSVAFVDDYSAWVTGPTAEANRAGLESIINDALEWEKRSGATFEADKTTIIHFTRMAERNSETPYTIKEQEVKPTSSAKILGVVMDSGLRFKEHMARAAAKGLSAAMDLRRLRMASPRMARQLFVATVAPTVDYASNIWSHTCGLREAAWLDKAQRVGAQAITGTFRTVATAVAEAEASIQPQCKFGQLPEGVGKYSKRMDKALPGNHTRALYDTLMKREAKVLAQLRTGMSALNGYLHRIGVAESDMCDCGQAAETIEHFLFRCKKWTAQREIMFQYSRTKMGNLSFFLGGKAASDGDKWRPDMKAPHTWQTVLQLLRIGR